MAINKDRDDLELYKFKESSSVSGQPGIVIINPDGTNIGTGANVGLIGAGSNAQIKDGTFYADGVSSGLLGIGQYTFNGTNYDRFRGTVDTSALITATGATTTQTGADQTNYNGKGLIVVLDMTTVGTGSVTLTIQGKDAASGKYYTLLAGAAVTTNSTNVYTVYPGAPVTANVSTSLPLPRTWRVLVTANNANPTTYTVGASVIV